jgi:hypothetical protein
VSPVIFLSAWDRVVFHFGGCFSLVGGTWWARWRLFEVILVLVFLSRLLYPVPDDHDGSLYVT